MNLTPWPLGVSICCLCIDMPCVPIQYLESTTVLLQMSRLSLPVIVEVEVHLARSVQHIFGRYIRPLEPWTIILPIGTRAIPVIATVLTALLRIISTVSSDISSEAGRYLAGTVIIWELSRKTSSILNISVTVILRRPMPLVVNNIFSICPAIRYLHECRYCFWISPSQVLD